MSRLESKWKKYLTSSRMSMEKTKAGEKQITVCLPKMDENIVASYDRKWTLEALGNILDNAVKYSPEESRIVVEVKEYEFYVCIRVKDQGIGIPEEERAQIFGRFYRGRQVQQKDGSTFGIFLSKL